MMRTMSATALSWLSTVWCMAAIAAQNCTVTEDCGDTQYCPVNGTECAACSLCTLGSPCVSDCSFSTVTTTLPTSVSTTSAGITVLFFDYNDPDPDNTLLQVVVPLLAFALFFSFACCAIFRPMDCRELGADLYRECSCWMAEKESVTGDREMSPREIAAVRLREARERREQVQLHELLGVDNLRPQAENAANAHHNNGPDGDEGVGNAAVEHINDNDGADMIRFENGVEEGLAEDVGHVARGGAVATDDTSNDHGLRGGASSGTPGVVESQPLMNDGRQSVTSADNNDDHNTVRVRAQQRALVTALGGANDVAVTSMGAAAYDLTGLTEDDDGNVSPAVSIAWPEIEDGETAESRV